jgi:hypothetical protein
MSVTTKQRKIAIVGSRAVGTSLILFYTIVVNYTVVAHFIDEPVFACDLTKANPPQASPP